jgi:hypothetical protein
MKSEVRRIAEMLDAARVPKEVFIGTDSTADRVQWVLRRLEMKERQVARLSAESAEARLSPLPACLQDKQL